MPGEVVPNHQHPHILKGGSSLGSVTFTESPSCQLCHSSRFCSALSTSSGGGKVSRTTISSSLGQGWSASLVARLTPRTRTSPLAGWKRVSNLAVPWRTYSWGLRFGSPIGCQLTPGYGTVWYGPASSSVHTVSPELSPSVSSALDQLFLAVASGSMTSTTSPLRFRSTPPVSHQLRSLCHSKPASFKVFQMV